MTVNPHASLPRPEHPRPDLHRGMRPGIDWQNLNGDWHFAFDPDDRGLSEGWSEPSREPFPRTIVVPFPWESHLAWGTQAQAGNDDWFSREAWLDPGSVTRDNYREAARHTVGWYRRSFTLPEDWHGRRVWLIIGAADWQARVWLNGQEVGAAESGYLPIEFDLTDALGAGENTLVIRVEDPEDHSQQPIGKQISNWYTRTSGIWQTVWLEPRGEAYATEVRVLPDLADERAELVVSVRAPDGMCDLVVEADVRAAAGPTVATVGPARVGEEGEVRLAAEIPAPIPWTPDAPHMYRVTVRVLSDDETLDTVHTQFGMRDIDVGPLDEDGPAYIRLNGRSVYLRGALDQSFHPEGVYSHPSNEAIRRDLLLAKQAGLNFLRLHIKTPDPRYCYWADRVGVLLMCDMPGFGYDGYSEPAKRRWERNAWGQIRRDFNHPSIFAWCLFNETWGLGGREYADLPERQEWVRACYEEAKRLDPTRLVEDNSACLYDHVITDINSWHFYINDCEQAREHVEHVVAQTRPGSPFNYVPGHEQGDEPLLNSEYGGISARMGDLDVSWCLLFLTNELRRHEQVCGYVYTELTDIEWEHNGIYDYDRGTKQFGYDPALILGEEFVGFDCVPAITVAPGATVETPVFLRPSARAASLARRTTWRATFTDRFGHERVLVRPCALKGVAGDRASIAVTVPEEPGLVRIEALARDRRGRPSAMNLRFIEIVDGNEDATVDGGLALRLLAGAGEADFEGPVERAEVDGVAHLLAGRGDGELTYRFALPDGIRGEDVASLTVLAELSSAREGAPQTSADRWPTRLRVALGATEAAELELPDQPADARGALSHMHGLLGRYGTLVTAKLAGEQARAAVEGGTVSVTFTTERAASDRGGLTVYGSRAGRYPCDVTLFIKFL